MASETELRAMSWRVSTTRKSVSLRNLVNFLHSERSEALSMKVIL